MRTWTNCHLQAVIMLKCFVLVFLIGSCSIADGWSFKTMYHAERIRKKNPWISWAFALWISIFLMGFEMVIHWSIYIYMYSFAGGKRWCWICKDVRSTHLTSLQMAGMRLKMLFVYHELMNKYVVRVYRIPMMFFFTHSGHHAMFSGGFWRTGPYGEQFQQVTVLWIPKLRTIRGMNTWGSFV